MGTVLNPYLSFKDNARQAMEFYETVFGGKLTLGTFGEFGAAQDPAEADLIMHGDLEGASGIRLMGADTPSRMQYTPGNNVSMSLSGEDEAELRGYFDKLADGGTVTMPLEKAMWGDMFGMCTDRFGVQWLVNVNAPKE
jgi:PhnB protein